MKRTTIPLLLASLVLAAPVSAQIYNNGAAKGGGGSFGITTDFGTGFGGSDASQAASAYGRSIFSPVYADDFTLGGFQSSITSLTVYSHVLNYTSTVSPLTSTTINIYSGRPGDAGTTLIATSSNQTSSIFSNVYRVPSGSTSATLTDNSRPVFATTVGFTNLTLNAGTYWFSFQQTTSAPGSIDVSGITKVVNGSVQMVAGNALGFDNNAWVPLYHLASPAGTDPNAPAIQTELPFLVNGRAIAAPVAPEPGSLALVMLPIAASLGFYRFRRRRPSAQA